MKDVFIGISVTVVLAIGFSLFGLNVPPYPPGGNGPRFPGDSGTVLPGGGETTEQLAEEPFREHTGDKNGHHLETAAETGQFQFIQSKEEHTTMTEMLVSFWHGVAAVLIGESCALMVAAAYLRMKIRSDRKEKENE